tara:strand:+ start:129 stop:803 length:675 start_codon:yes stop_codon:yes gene_type:complete
MAISINTVYQKVLAVANKEQRGYITPQEFNLFANQAQLEIVEQYFYDIAQFSRLHENDTDYSDMVHLIETKMNLLEERSDADLETGTAMSDDVFRLGKVMSNGYECQRVTHAELSLMGQTSLCSPSSVNPVYYQEGNEIHHSGGNFYHHYHYIKKPQTVSWGYVVINNNAMYDPGTTTDFEISSMEETELVYRILTLSGIAIKRTELAQFGAGSLQQKTQQEKS